MGKTRHTTRLFGIVARHARTAVVFRRGPSKQVRMIHWDLARDVFMPGQWLSGRIYNERCDISPDGQLVVYFAGKFKTALQTFTAVCRPPYFTALALWPEGTTWGGGGFFETDSRLVLNYARVIEELNGAETIPPNFEVTHLLDFRSRYDETHAIAHHGWELVQVGKDAKPPPESTLSYVYDPPWIHRKANPRRLTMVLERDWLGMFETNGPSSVYAYRLVETTKRDVVREDLGRIDWAGWDHDGSLLWSADGQMHRRRIAGSLSESPSVLLADFRDDVFTNIPPPDHARMWPR